MVHGAMIKIYFSKKNTTNLSCIEIHLYTLWSSFHFNFEAGSVMTELAQRFVYHSSPSGKYITSGAGKYHSLEEYLKKIKGDVRMLIIC